MGAFEKMGRFVSSKRSCIKNRLVAAQVSAKKDVEAAVSWPQYVPLPQYVSSGSLSLIVSSTLTVHLQEDKKSQSQFLFFQSPIKVLSKGSAGVNINKLQPPQNLQSPLVENMSTLPRHIHWSSYCQAPAESAPLMTAAPQANQQNGKDVEDFAGD